MSSFLSGFLCCAFFVAGLFFWRFWRSSRDRLFVFFSSGFWLMSFEHLIVAARHEEVEWDPLVYLLRLFGFVLIIAGIVDKNRKR